MRLSISNIAWDSEEDDLVIPLLKKMGITEIEIAPTKFWKQPLQISDSQIDNLRRDWLNKGFSFVAMQSLLFGQNHLNMFSSDDSRQEMVHYLSGIISLAGKLGVNSLVFGSPKNRKAGSLSHKKQMDIAIPFFEQLGTLAGQAGVILCIEANPVQYGCDFITNTDEAITLVREVGNPGFRLHLDAGAMALNNEDIYSVIERSMPYLQHFHVSEPYLNLVGPGITKHKQMAQALKALGYDKWVSIEMKNNLLSNNTESVETAVTYALETYIQQGANLLT
ncbi:sugar phosphate isomerase/epimerase [Paenibacillus oralis]|uniref:Sugar phosphate isomerase/epimerase n=1 Tax=Paenibacillus oralis TaxID=2490856 RepID=A0A3P3TVM4_9BACL|nr:sugar phosphate isomerase/epimerase family protein [Paenibacillus oralis]RRJ62197.1 sugar phosphate isomerase/epimerase [Paenibacillus oralis]